MKQPLGNTGCSQGSQQSQLAASNSTTTLVQFADQLFILGDEVNCHIAYNYGVSRAHQPQTKWQQCSSHASNATCRSHQW